MAHRRTRGLDAGRKLLLAVAGMASVVGPVAVGVSTAQRLRGQSEPATPLKFEVASVKPFVLPANELLIPSPDRPIEAHGDRFRDVGSLIDFIIDAYNVKDYQISGLPHWAESVFGDQFVIDAKAEGTPTEKEWRLMLQTLLADRFKLKLHREMKDRPVYALVIDKNGSKLRKLREDEQVPTYATPPREPPKVMMSTIPELIEMLAFHVDRPVVDQTGLTGMYEYANLDWEQFGRDKRAAPLDPQSGESVFAAVQRELGLKLEPRKDPLEILVIDHTEKPTAN